MSHCGPAIVSSSSVDAIRLQLSLVKEHFGEKCSKVVQAVLRREQPFQRICDSAGLGAADTREAMLWLLQHDIISSIESGTTESLGRVGSALYQVNTWRILIRQRVPRMLKYTHDVYGKTAEFALQSVLLHGRITLPHLVSCVQSKYPDLDEMQIHAVVLDLMQNHLLMRRFGNEHPDYAVDVTSSSENGSSPRKTVLKEQLRDAQEERDYFSFVDVNRVVAKETEASSPTSRPAKRARTGDMEAVTGSFASAGEGVYLVVNYAQFVRCFLREWVVNYVANKIDPVCGEIMKGIFDAVMLHPNKAGDRSKAVEMKDLSRYLPPKYAVLSPVVIERHVRLLSTFGGGVIAKMGDYIQVDYRRLRELARYTAIERVVTLKCGRECARLFRLIHTRKYVEQKQVKDLALVGSFKEAKSQLNTLFRNQYITMQEMPKQAGDRAPSKCFYVWKCNLEHVARVLVDMSYKVQANLALRAGSDRRAYDDIKRRLDKQPDPSEHADQLRANADKASMERIAGKLNRIEQAILEADEQVMMLRDFDEIPYEGRNSLNSTS